MAADLGVPFLGRVPLDPLVVSSGDAGLPYLTALDGPVAGAFGEAFGPLVARVLGGDTEGGDD